MLAILVIMRVVMADLGLQVFAAIYWGLFDRAVWDGMGGSDKSSGNLTEASKVRVFTFSL